MTEEFERDVIRLAGAAGAAVVTLQARGQHDAADRLQAAIDALGSKPKERDDG